MSATSLRAERPRGRVSSGLFKAFLIFSMAVGIVTFFGAKKASLLSQYSRAEETAVFVSQ